MWAVYAWLPFGYTPSLHTGVKIAISVILVTIALLIWGKYAAPKSKSRLSGLRLVGLKSLILLPAAILLGVRLGTATLLIGTIIVGINVLIEYAGASKQGR